MEMAPFGVEVLLVQLGAVLSALVENSKSAQLPDRFLSPGYREIVMPLVSPGASHGGERWSP